FRRLRALPSKRQGGLTLKIGFTGSRCQGLFLHARGHFGEPNAGGLRYPNHATNGWASPHCIPDMENVNGSRTSCVTLHPPMRAGSNSAFGSHRVTESRKSLYAASICPVGRFFVGDQTSFIDPGIAWPVESTRKSMMMTAVMPSLRSDGGYVGS